jgi:hypothetical protein
MAMKMANGKLATNSKENMAVFEPHFDRVFNNQCPVDQTILNIIPHHPTLHDIDSPITFDEVNATINKLKNGKSPSLNGIPPKAYKTMNTETRQRVHEYVAAFFEGDPTMMAGMRANVCQSPSQAISLTQTNGVASCSWMCAARSSPQ